MRAETGHGPLAVDFFHDQVERRFQIRHRDALVNHHAFNLMEHRRMRRIHLILTVHTARGDHTNRQLLGLHRVNLHGRGLRTKADAAVFREVEGVCPFP